MREFLSYFCVCREDYDKIKTEVWQENWKGLRFFSCITAAAFGAMAVTSLFSHSIRNNFSLYMAYCLLSLFYWVASRRQTDSILLKEVLVCGFFGMLLSFGIVMGTIISPEDRTVGYIVLMIAVPILFQARASLMNSLIVLSMIVYILLAFFTQSEDIFTYNVLNVVLSGVVSMFLTAAMMCNKAKKLLYQTEVAALEKMEQESEKRIRHYETFITDMVRYASSEEKPDKVLDQLVKYIGEELHSDRSYIFEENRQGTYDNTYEWCAEGISREKENLQNVPYEGVVEIWFQQYRKSNNIVIRDVEEYRKESEAVYELLKPQGINTLVTGPIVIGGKMIGFYGVDNPPRELLSDISDLIGMMEFVVSFLIRLRDNAKTLEYSALHDQLTGCKNRKALDWVYGENRDTGKSLAVLMCDLNDLKEINDNQGHDAGDRFIIKVAQTLKSVFGDEQVYRIGGDEFLVVLTGISKGDFEQKAELAGIQLGVTASIGVSYSDTMDTDVDLVLKLADVEMYKQKSRYHTTAGNDRRKPRQ